MEMPPQIASAQADGLRTTRRDALGLGLATTAGLLADRGYSAEPAQAAQPVQAMQEGGGLINVKSYGVQGDGMTDDTTAIQKVIGALPETGGLLWFPAGTYLHSGLSLEGKSDVALIGVGGCQDTAGCGSILFYTGTNNTDAIDLKSAKRVTIASMQLLYRSSTFTGYLINAENPGPEAATTRFISFVDCVFAGNPGTSATNAQALCYLGNTHSIKFERCAFMEAQIGVLGRKMPSEFSNAVLFDHCFFQSNYRTHVRNAGHAWLFTNCVFEPLAGGQAGAYAHDDGMIEHALGFQGCWMGDISMGDGQQIAFGGKGLSVVGNRIGAEYAEARIITIDASHAAGIDISGNHFVGPGGPVVSFEPLTEAVGVLGPNSYEGIAEMTAGAIPISFQVLSQSGAWSNAVRFASGITMNGGSLVARCGASGQTPILAIRPAGKQQDMMVINYDGEIFRGLGSEAPNLRDIFGYGSPEGIRTAGIGSLYHRLDGKSGTCLYVKETGTGNRGWVAK